MIPTQRSVVAKPRNKSLDGLLSVVSLWSAIRIRVFPKNAVMEKMVFATERNTNSLCSFLVNSAEQYCCVYVPVVAMFLQDKSKYGRSTVAINDRWSLLSEAWTLEKLLARQAVATIMKSKQRHRTKRERINMLLISSVLEAKFFLQVQHSGLCTMWSTRGQGPSNHLSFILRWLNKVW